MVRSAAAATNTERAGILRRISDAATEEQLWSYGSPEPANSAQHTDSCRTSVKVVLIDLQFSVKCKNPVDKVLFGVVFGSRYPSFPVFSHSGLLVVVTAAAHPSGHC